MLLYYNVALAGSYANLILKNVITGPIKNE